MRARFVKLSVCVFLSVIITSCKKSETPKPIDNPKVDVYAAGYVRTSANISDAVYWKNGTVVKLGSGSNATDALSMVLNGSDVYVVGNLSGQAGYWKNGVGTELPTDTDGPSYATSIAFNGSDMYITGYSFSKATSRSEAVYWKNNVLVKLTDIGATSAVANCITISNNDIYIAGSVSVDPGSLNRVAVYWKNGVIQNLAGNIESNAVSIAVSGTDVYTSGLFFDGIPIACYWKNKTLTRFEAYDEAPVILAQGANIYLAGDGQKGIFYWKNGTSSIIANNAFFPKVFGIALLGNDVYLAGILNNKATYWKNGSSLPIDKSTLQSGANSIIVVDK